MFLPDQHEWQGYNRDISESRNVTGDANGGEGRMKRLNKEQVALLSSMGLPTSFDKMTDDELMAVEDVLADEMQANGLNDTGDGLNERGMLCRSVIVAMPD